MATSPNLASLKAPISAGQMKQARKMEMKKTTLAFALILLIVSVSMEVPVSAQIGCLDACQTGCVGRPGGDRGRIRCERKCEIRCGPDSRGENSGGD